MPVIASPGRSFDFTVPVAVVGGGACGLAAALAARDAGADVMVLERDRHPSGSTAMSLGAICAVRTQAQAAAGVVDDPESFIADVMAKTQERTDPRLVRTVAYESGPTVDWLTARHRVPLGLDFAWTGLGHSQPRLHLTPGRNGEELMSLLSEAAAHAGAGLMTGAHVTDLCVDDSQRVLGLRIVRPDGAVEELGCDALVLACCGFGGNREMIRRYIPEMANARYFGHEGNQGEGIQWGMALGAAVADLSSYQGLGTLGEPHGIVVPHPLMSEGGVLVNVNSERFTHEMANISGMCVPVLAQPQGIAFVIFDERRFASTLSHSHELRQLAEVGAVRRADTLAGLEAACGLPAGSLTRTLAEVDDARRAGRADRLGRSWDGLPPLEPPFCALKATGALFHTQGGLVVDEHARVLRPDGTPLPNLFAGGGAARGISGPDVTGYLPAMGLCMAVTLGRLAGHTAAQLASQAVPS